MGGVVSGGIGMASIACQSLICCTSLTSCCLSAGNGLNGISAKAAKGFYILLLGLATMMAMYLRYYGDTLGINLSGWNVHCSSSDDEQDVGPSVAGYSYLDEEHYIYCKGDAAVFRISFVLSVFFLVMTCLTISGDYFHRGFWGIKLLGLFLGLLLCFFIPNSFFDNSGFAWIARVVSMAFLVLQILILIDFGYQLNDSLVERAFPADGEENYEWVVVILGSSAVLYLVSLVGIPLLFTFYGECYQGILFSSLTLIGIVVFTGLTLFRDRLVGLEGAILPAAVVASYVTYLTWSSLDSNPDSECKPYVSGAGTTANMWIGILIAAISLMWTSLSVSSSLEALVTGEESEDCGEPNASTPLYSVEGADGASQRVERQSFESAGSEGGEKNVWVFHLVMLTASMYMSMILTEWGANENAHGNDDGNISTASMWVKQVSGWMTILLYIWTLVAPAVLGRYRDFDF